MMYRYFIQVKLYMCVQTHIHADREPKPMPYAQRENKTIMMYRYFIQVNAKVTLEARTKTIQDTETQTTKAYSSMVAARPEASLRWEPIVSL